LEMKIIPQKYLKNQLKIKIETFIILLAISIFHMSPLITPLNLHFFVWVHKLDFLF
jgi:hypothetical protein